MISEVDIVSDNSYHLLTITHNFGWGWYYIKKCALTWGWGWYHFPTIPLLGRESHSSQDSAYSAQWDIYVNYLITDGYRYADYSSQQRFN